MFIIPAPLAQVAAQVPRPDSARPRWRRVLVVLAGALAASSGMLPPGYSATDPSPPSVTHTVGASRVEKRFTTVGLTSAEQRPGCHIRGNHAEATAVTRIDPAG